MMTDSLSWDSFTPIMLVMFRWKFLQSIQNKWHLVVHWMHHLDQKQRNLIKSKPFQKTWERVTASEEGGPSPPVILDRAPESISGSVFLIDPHLDFLPFFVWVCLSLSLDLSDCLSLSLYTHPHTHPFPIFQDQKKNLSGSGSIGLSLLWLPLFLLAFFYCAAVSIFSLLMRKTSWL